MAVKVIGTGSSPNDGTGDNLRTAGGKINDNFTEIYDYFGDGSTLSNGRWDVTNAGINTISNVGIGTTNPIDAADTNNTKILNVGIVTANFYYGDGSNLSGVISGITVQDEGSSLSTTATTLNFVGSGVVASGTGATKTITISNTGGTVSSGSFTASAGTPSTLETYAYDSAELVFEYTAFVKNGSDYQTQKLLVMRDGTTVDSTQYAIMHSNGLLVQLDATISGSNLLLRATPETGVTGSTTYRIKREVV